MKRVLSVLLLILLAASLVACSPQAEPAETPVPGQTETPNPSLPPDPGSFVPMDIFGNTFNPYADEDFPTNFTIYAAAFSKGAAKLEGKSPYILSMTAEGKIDESIAFLAKLAGITDAQTTAQQAEDFKNDGYCEFDGVGNAVFTIRETDRGDDRYEYVKGFHAEIWINLTEAQVPRYFSLIRDSFNVNALTAARDYFDVTPVFDECAIAVNLHKKQVCVEMRYTVADVAAVQKSIAETVKSNWYDVKNGKMGFSYGIFGIELLFDGKGGNIYVNETTSDTKSVLSAYVEPEVSFAKLGFGFDLENICGVYEQHEPHYMSLAVHRPEWGEFDGGWNLEYYDTVNGYVMRITYHADEHKYRITADKNDVGGAFNYFPATGKYVDEHPDSDTIRQVFNGVFGTEGEDFYDKPIAYFEQLVQDRFGMSIDEFYALPIR